MANYRYPLTNKIKIFPSSLRGLRVTTDGTEAIQGPADGKFTSESNIASIVTTIAGKESYIKEIKENGASKYIIVIHGYRFLLEDLIPHEYKYRDKEGIILTETWENVYANILVEKTSGRLVDCDTRTTLDYKDTSQLYSEDTVYLFRGLFFSGVSNQASLTNDDYNCYSLHVTHKKEDKNEWELVYDSTQYLDGAHIYGSVDNTKNVTSTINKVLITDIFNVADAEKGITTAEVNNATNVTKKIDLRYIDDSARPAESQDPSIFEDYTDALTNPTHTKNSTNVTKTIDGRPIDLLSAGEGNACIFETGTNQTHVKNATNVTTNINGVAITSIFNAGTGSGTTTAEVNNATNVTTSINNKKIIDIFENDGVTVKKATNAKIASDTLGSSSGSTIYDRIWIGSDNKPDVSGAQYYEIGNAKHSQSAYKLDSGITINGTTIQSSGLSITTDRWGAEKKIQVISGSLTSEEKKRTKTETTTDGGKAGFILELPEKITADITGSLSGNATSATNSTNATNANITKIPDTTNGDQILIGSGTALNITNSAHSANSDLADLAGKLTTESAGDTGLISQSIIWRKGIPAGGQRVVASTTWPTDITPSVGDIWLVI